MSLNIFILYSGDGGFKVSHRASSKGRSEIRRASERGQNKKIYISKTDGGHVFYTMFANQHIFKHPVGHITN
jgi:hypothetical protein